MKVLIVAEHYPPFIGGVEVYFQHMAEGLAQRGHQVTVCTTLLPNTAKTEEHAGVRIVRIPLPTIGRRYWFTFLGIWWIWRNVRWADVVQTTTYNAALPTWLCARVFRKPIVITVHEVWGKFWRKITGMNAITARLHQLYEAIILHLPYSAYIADSEYTLHRLRAAVPSSSSTAIRIYPGLDYAYLDGKRYHPAAVCEQHGWEGKFVALYFGRPGWAKGIDTLIAALPELITVVPNIRIVLLVSKEPAARFQAVEQAVRRFQSMGTVQILPSVPRAQLPSYLLAADCVVVPSLSEGFGFAAAEASALGVPVASSNAGSLPEVVHGKVAFFHAGDPHDLTRAVQQLAQGNVMLLPGKTFLWSDFLDQLESVYQHVRQETFS